MSTYFIKFRTKNKKTIPGTEQYLSGDQAMVNAVVGRWVLMGSWWLGSASTNFVGVGSVAAVCPPSSTDAHLSSELPSVPHSHTPKYTTSDNDDDRMIGFRGIPVARKIFSIEVIGVYLCCRFHVDKSKGYGDMAP